MSLKSLTQTQWKIEPDKVTIYPYKLSQVLSLVLALIFGALLSAYIIYLNASYADAATLGVVSLSIVLVFWGSSFTSISFDNQSGIMFEKLLGFIPTSQIHFSKLQGINPVTNLSGSYTYRIFKKNSKYGKGIRVSSAYSKNDDPNAIAFVNEAAVAIHKLLDQHDTITDTIAEQIFEYKYFNRIGDQFTIKKNKIGGIILGVVLFALGVHELTPYAWMGDGFSLGRIFFLLATVVGGPIIVFSTLTDISLDKNSKIIARNGPINFSNKSYIFDDILDLQVVRKSTNFIYSGTEIRLYLKRPNSTKEDILILASFYRTHNIERFISEFRSITN